MSRMTKTEANDVIAIDVLAWARQYGGEIDKDLIEARVSELRSSIYAGTYKHEAAHTVTSWRSILTLIKKWS